MKKITDKGHESWASRWFGYEYNPKRRKFIRRASGFIGLAVAVSSLVRAGLHSLGPVSWVLSALLFLTFFTTALVYFRRGLREPHWGSPQAAGEPPPGSD